MEGLIELLSGYAVEALAVALVGLVGMVAKLVGMKISEATEQKIRQAALLAIGFAEERARQYIQQTGGKMAKAAIEEIAVHRLIEKLPKIDEAEARRIVASVLPYARPAMEAAAGELGNALRTPESPAQ